MELNITGGADGARLEPVPVDDAVKRVLTYCMTPGTGWESYDLAGVAARADGLFDQVTPWSLLYANALNGRVDLKNVAAFHQARRAEFAELLRAIPQHAALGHRRPAAEPEQPPGSPADAQAGSPVDPGLVVAACSFGFAGAWAPKITKVAALFRPQAVPVLDGHVANAFGFNRGDLRGSGRDVPIKCVVEALAAWLSANPDQVGELRERVEVQVPDVKLISDVRLIDIVVWTSWDDLSPWRSPDKVWRWDNGPAAGAVAATLAQVSGVRI